MNIFNKWGGGFFCCCYLPVTRREQKKSQKPGAFARLRAAKTVLQTARVPQHSLMSLRPLRLAMTNRVCISRIRATTASAKLILPRAKSLRWQVAAPVAVETTRALPPSLIAPEASRRKAASSMLRMTTLAFVKLISLHAQLRPFLSLEFRLVVKKALRLSQTAKNCMFLIIDHRAGILEIDMQTNVATLLVGGTKFITEDGIEAAAGFNGPESMAISPDGTSLVVADDGNASRAIRAVAIETKAVLTLGKLGRESVTPTGDAADPKIGVASGIYIADSQNRRIKQLKLGTSGGAIQIVDFAGNSTEESKDGPLQQANFSRPEVIAVNSAGTKIFVIDSAIDKTASPAAYTHHRVRMIEYK